MNLRTRLLFEFALFALVFGALFFNFGIISQAKNNDISSSSIIFLTNKDREIDGIKELKPNVDLQKAAQMKADDMAQNGYFSHTTPTGQTPWFWFKKANYSYKNAGEN